MRRTTPHFGTDRELYALSGETGGLPAGFEPAQSTEANRRPEDATGRDPETVAPLHFCGALPDCAKASKLSALSDETGALYASRYATSIVLSLADAQRGSTAFAIRSARDAGRMRSII